MKQRLAEEQGWCCRGTGVRWKGGRWRYCGCNVGTHHALADVRHAHLIAQGTPHIAEVVARETIDEAKGGAHG
ncbi:MAG: hypothetical protein SFW67_35585 [Myxococcaceae bacterium]|nr:hypothetical protein [Myxococcaceae bacterium]